MAPLPLPLEVGIEVRCPHCRRWHPVAPAPRPTEHAYAADMLYFICPRGAKAGTYYAGQHGGAARYPTRATSA